MTTMMTKSTFEALTIGTSRSGPQSNDKELRRTTHGKAVITVAEMMFRYVGLRMVMIHCHDALISRLMEFPAFIVDIVLVRYEPSHHGAPSVEAVDAIVGGLEDEGCFGPAIDHFG